MKTASIENREGTLWFLEERKTFCLPTFPTFPRRAKRASGYALLDVVLATTVFAIWGTGLVALLQNISETSGGYSRDRLVQYQIESLITEARHKPIQEVTSEFLDEVLEVTYTTTLEPLELGNVDGDRTGESLPAHGHRDLAGRRGISQSEIAEVLSSQTSGRRPMNIQHSTF